MNKLKNQDRFLEELTALSKKYKIYIGSNYDSPCLFELKAIDEKDKYIIDGTEYLEWGVEWRYTRLRASCQRESKEEVEEGEENENSA